MAHPTKFLLASAVIQTYSGRGEGSNVEVYEFNARTLKR